MNFKYLFIGAVVIVLMQSCDAINQLQYAVYNQSENAIKLHIPKYPINRDQGVYSTYVDTIIEISPGEQIWIGSSPVSIDFPWATKKIYKRKPGICGVEIIRNESNFLMGCTTNEWSYRNGQSILKIK